MRILIVDDCGITRRLLTAWLSPFGKCTEAKNGSEALSLFKEASEDKEQSFGLICMDLSMPEMGGAEALRKIRDYEKEENIPPENAVKVIIVTSFSDEKSMLKVYSQCQGFIMKPIVHEKLLEKLSMIGIFPYQVHKEEKESQRETKSDYADMVPTVKDQNGKLEFFISRKSEDSAGKKEYPIDPAELEFFKNVITGQMLVKTEKGETSLKAGEGVHFNEKKGIFFASRNGMVEVSGNTISVNNTMTINEDIKLEDVDFLGKVEINGDISDGINIRGEKGVIINGLVGSSSIIKSSGDINIRRVNGKNETRIICGGDFSAQLVYDSTVECRGNIEIEKEAVDSILKSSGKLKAGTVIGGECVAFTEIEVDRAGSPKDVSTLLNAGHDFYRIDRTEFLEENIKKLEEEIKRVNIMLGPHSEKLIESMVLSDEKKLQVFQLRQRKTELEKEKERSSAELEKLNSTPPLEAKPKIKVNKILYKGVRIVAGEKEELVYENLEGPLAIDCELINL